MNFNLRTLIEAGILIVAFIILMKFIGSNLIQNLFKPVEPEIIEKQDKQQLYISSETPKGHFGNTWINYKEDEIETIYARGGKGNPKLLCFTRVKKT